MKCDSLCNAPPLRCGIPGSTSGTGTSSFTYNGQDELTQETSTRNGTYSNSFVYDAAFNPTTFKGVTHTFNVNNQDNLISYDANGNPSSYNGNSTTFDPEDRMTAFGSLLTAGYTGDFLRAWKQTAAGRTYFLYDGRRPVVEINSSGAVTAVNSFGAAGLLSRHTSAASVFYQFDPQGSVAQRLDANQNVLSTLVFDAYGKELSGGSTGEPWGFGAQSGYYTDNETGLILCTRRYYDPSAGRWLNRDPIGYRGGMNLYAYVGNGPERQSDPSGEFPPLFGGIGRFAVPVLNFCIMAAGFTHFPVEPYTPPASYVQTCETPAPSPVSGANWLQDVPPEPQPIGLPTCEIPVASAGAEGEGAVALGPGAGGAAAVAAPIGADYYVWERWLKPWMKDCVNGILNQASNPPGLYGTNPNDPWGVIGEP